MKNINYKAKSVSKLNGLLRQRKLNMLSLLLLMLPSLGVFAQADSSQMTHIQTTANPGYYGGTTWRYSTDYLNGSSSATTGSGEIYFYNFGFNIPSNAIITGVKVSFDRWGTANTTDLSVKLRKGTVYSSDKSSSTIWPVSATTMSAAGYGSSTDKWGFNALTPTMVNSDSFGLAVECKTVATSGGGLTLRPQAHLGEPTITVYYYEPHFQNDAEAIAFVEPRGLYCADSQLVKMSIRNNGTNNITSLLINWKVNGVSQPTVTYGGTLVPSTATSGKNKDTVTLGKVYMSGSATSGTSIQAWTYLPNNSTDSLPANDTILESFSPTTFTVSAQGDTICPGDDAALSLSPSTGYPSGAIAWQSSANGTSWSNISNASSVNYIDSSLASTRWYRAKISGVGTCYSNDVKVTVLASSVMVSNSDTICGSGKASLSGTASSGAVLQWYSSATAASPLDTGNSFTTSTVNTTTPFYVSAKIGACESTRDTVYAVVFDLPNVDLGGATGFCPGGSVILYSGTNDSLATYMWSDSTTADSLLVNAAGQYYVQVTGGNGCVASDTVNVRKYAMPLINLGADTTGFCEGTTLTLYSGADTTFQISWNNGANTANIDVAAAGMYTITVQSDKGCVNTDSIYVLEIPLPSVQNITANNQGCDFRFSAQGASDVSTYKWNFGDGSSSTSANPSHSYASSGTYKVILVVTNQCGSDTINTTVECIPTGINDVRNNSAVRMYPNPANHILTIENKGQVAIRTISVYNILGQEVYVNQNAESVINQINVANFASGIYQVKMVMTDGKLLMQRFEVNR